MATICATNTCNMFAGCRSALVNQHTKRRTKSRAFCVVSSMNCGQCVCGTVPETMPQAFQLYVQNSLEANSKVNEAGSAYLRLAEDDNSGFKEALAGKTDEAKAYAKQVEAGAAIAAGKSKLAATAEQLRVKSMLHNKGKQWEEKATKLVKSMHSGPEELIRCGTSKKTANLAVKLYAVLSTSPTMTLQDFMQLPAQQLGALAEGLGETEKLYKEIGSKHGGSVQSFEVATQGDGKAMTRTELNSTDTDLAHTNLCVALFINKVIAHAADKDAGLLHVDTKAAMS